MKYLHYARDWGWDIDTIRELSRTRDGKRRLRAMVHNEKMRRKDAMRERKRIAALVAYDRRES